LGTDRLDGRLFVKYVLFYQSAADVRAKAPPHVHEHSARIKEFHARGTLLMIGVFANPEEGAMGVFTTREAAEEFARGDAFVLNGVVRDWRVSAWNESLA
jgi:uncharacterized protein YciI